MLQRDFSPTALVGHVLDAQIPPPLLQKPVGFGACFLFWFLSSVVPSDLSWCSVVFWWLGFCFDPPKSICLPGKRGDLF